MCIRDRHMTARLKGGVTEEEVANVFAMMRDQMAQLQAALNEDKGKSENMRQTFQNANTKGQDGGGISSAIRKGQMKDISPKKYINVQTTGNFRAWAKTMKDLFSGTTKTANR